MTNQTTASETTGERRGSPPAPRADQGPDDVQGSMWMLYAAGAAFGFAMGAGAAGAGYLGYKGIVGDDVVATKSKYN